MTCGTGDFLCENAGRLAQCIICCLIVRIVDALRTSKGGMGMRGPGDRDRNRPTILGSDPFVKDKIKAIDKQIGTQRSNRWRNGSCGSGRIY
jgi:GTP-binding protein HflX